LIFCNAYHNFTNGFLISCDLAALGGPAQQGRSLAADTADVSAALQSVLSLEGVAQEDLRKIGRHWYPQTATIEPARLVAASQALKHSGIFSDHNNLIGE
jgi:hypothetical protein